MSVNEEMLENHHAELTHNKTLGESKELPAHERVGRKPTVKPERYVTIGLAAEDLAAIKAFMNREAMSNQSEAIRSALRRYFRAEGLMPPPSEERGADE